MDLIEIATWIPWQFFSFDLLYFLLMSLNWSLIFTHHPEFEFLLEVPLDTLSHVSRFISYGWIQSPCPVKISRPKKKALDFLLIVINGRCMILQKHSWTKVNLITHRLCKHFAYISTWGKRSKPFKELVIVLWITYHL